MEKNNKIFKTEQIKIIEQTYCGSDIDQQLILMERAAESVIQNLIKSLANQKNCMFFVVTRIMEQMVIFAL